MKTCHEKIDGRWNEGILLVESMDKRLASVEGASKMFNSSLDELTLKGLEQVEENEKLKKRLIKLEKKRRTNGD